jgi:uncharacterized protein (TIGR00255 family)
MKLRSMTGFGGAEATNDHISVKAEIKSLNGKFLELNIRMPRSIQNKEIALRKDLTKKIERGSATLYLTIERNLQSSDAALIDKEIAQKLYGEIELLQKQLGNTTSNILDRVLAFPGVINADGADEIDDDDWKLITNTVDTAFNEFEKFRTQEGDAIKEELVGFVNSIKEGIPEVEKYEGERITQLRERISNQLNTMLDEEKVDKDRFEQEMIYYLEKIDINEEKSRLAQHCKYFIDTINKEPSGKKLGFIAQEIGREVNTLGSKASHVEIQQIVVGMKDSLEKVKEQVLNVL